jgi:hypothetical protein
MAPPHSLLLSRLRRVPWPPPMAQLLRPPRSRPPSRRRHRRLHPHTRALLRMLTRRHPRSWPPDPPSPTLVTCGPATSVAVVISPPRPILVRRRICSLRGPVRRLAFSGHHLSSRKSARSASLHRLVQGAVFPSHPFPLCLTVRADGSLQGAAMGCL